MAIETHTMIIRGMTCGNCARSVERKLAAVPGVTKATVDLQRSSASVAYEAGRVETDALAQAVRQLGFEVPA
jgi:copper chaperone CopZ